MLFLLCQIDRTRYALDVREIVEVLPFVRLMPVPHGPLGLAGLVRYRGLPVPVVDLSNLLTGRDAIVRLTTRLLIVKHRGRSGEERRLGLIVEQATETLRKDPADFVGWSGTAEGEAHTNRVACDAGGLVQRLDVGAVLPAALAGVLFADLPMRHVAG